MATSDPGNAPVATPPAAGEGGSHRHPRATDRRLRVEDILKLMVAEGLVTAVDADQLARSRTHRLDRPMEMIADQKWRSLAAARPMMTLDWLV